MLTCIAPLVEQDRRRHSRPNAPEDVDEVRQEEERIAAAHLK